MPTRTIKNAAKAITATAFIATVATVPLSLRSESPMTNAPISNTIPMPNTDSDKTDGTKHSDLMLGYIAAVIIGGAGAIYLTRDKKVGKIGR